MKIKFIPANKHPEKSGQYLMKLYPDNVMLVSVRYFNECFDGGTAWFGISEFNGRNVEEYDASQFSDPIEFQFPK